MTTDSKAAPSMAEQVATALGRDDLISRKAAMEAIQSLRHAAAWNFSPAYSGSLGQARTDSFYEAYEAVRKMDPAALASTAGAGAGDWVTAERAYKDGYENGAGCYIGDGSPESMALAQGQSWDLYRAERLDNSPAVPASARSGAGELTEAEIRSRAATFVRSSGWQPGDSLHGKAVLDLMTKLGMSLVAEPPQDHCAYPDCGCEHDSVCDAALSQGGEAGRSEKGEGEEKAWTPVRTVAYLQQELERLRQDLRSVGEDLTDDQPKAVSWVDVAYGRAHNCISVLNKLAQRLDAPAQSPSTSDREG